MEWTLMLICFFATTMAQFDFDPTEHPAWSKLDHITCGMSLANRIIGGKSAKVAQYPWLARIGISRRVSRTKTVPFFFCGGTVINKRYIVSAGHCTKAPSPITTIRMGDYDSHAPESCNGEHCSAPTDYQPEEIFAHEKYHGNISYDISLFRTTEDIKFNYFVMPICLPSGDMLTKDLTGAMCETAGWGIKKLETKETSHVLLSLQMPIMAQEKCVEEFKFLTNVLPSQMCAGGVVGKDTCNGDSGGPLMRIEAPGNSPPRYHLIGIVSFGDQECGSTSMPGLYTRVSSFVGWILDHMNV